MNISCQEKRNATNEDQIALVTFLSKRHKNDRLNKGAIYAAMEYLPFKISQIKFNAREKIGRALKIL